MKVFPRFDGTNLHANTPLFDTISRDADTPGNIKETLRDTLHSLSMGVDEVPYELLREGEEYFEEIENKASEHLQEIVPNNLSFYSSTFDQPSSKPSITYIDKSNLNKDYVITFRPSDIEKARQGIESDRMLSILAAEDSPEGSQEEKPGEHYVSFSFYDENNCFIEYKFSELPKELKIFIANDLKKRVSWPK